VIQSLILFPWKEIDWIVCRIVCCNICDEEKGTSSSTLISR
jgi:hypothetical protein